MSKNSSSTSSKTDSNNKTAKVWDRFANNYAKQPIADEDAYQKKLKVTQQYLRPNMEVVEIGCGTGGTSIIHAPYVKHIIATDISSEMLKIAKEKAANVKNLEFQQASVDELNFPDKSKDVVLGLSILHLLPNKEEAMRKVHKWLKPGGLFVTSTVCAGDMGTIPKIFINTFMPIGQCLGLLPNFYPFTKSDLKKSFQDVGFSIEHEWQPEDKASAAVFIIGKKL